MNQQLQAGKAPLSILRFFAHFVSYVFHPLFIPLYVTWFLEFIHPGYFTGFSLHEKVLVLIRIAYTMVFLPAFTTFLLKKLDFISSFLLKTQKDRIIPYIVCGIYFFWMYLVFRNDENIPKILTGFILGIFFSSSAALIANIYYKISMHSIGMGGLIGVFLLIMQSNTMLMTWPLSAALLIAGVVCTSRLILNNHSPKEIYMGLLLGLVCQLVASVVVM